MKGVFLSLAGTIKNGSNFGSRILLEDRMVSLVEPLRTMSPAFTQPERVATAGSFTDPELIEKTTWVMTQTPVRVF
ncbi:hypothetical protein AVEN_38151-1 [Araneus ventricosus]|uniref:Alpha-carbonic anhydrase domain-containing protein n=1 Tax=Araneus ventricosus TaxID=182803 RepID=A0A4Y2F178_ARAVE|nr:hypothetical protein AVEN_38151-1 [Araneus ventricosus]